MSDYSLSVRLPEGEPVASGEIKRCAEDFYVEELWAESFSGAGEHVLLCLEKSDQNTEYVARQLARAAGVREMDIGFAGLKDRRAVTRQWFSVYLGNRPEPDWTGLALEGVRLLDVTRHHKKLRRGEHCGNLFRLTVRSLQHAEGIASALQQIKSQGFPNYFGEQRFGRAGQNLYRAEALFERRIKASGSQRAFYLSAVRAYLFNQNLSREVERGTWQHHATGGPLYGDAQPEVSPLTDEERAVLDAHPLFAAGIHQNRMKLMRRPYGVLPQAMSWHLEGDMLRLEFVLPPGAFATTLLQCVLRTESPGLEP